MRFKTVKAKGNILCRGSTMPEAILFDACKPASGQPPNPVDNTWRAVARVPVGPVTENPSLLLESIGLAKSWLLHVKVRRSWIHNLAISQSSATSYHYGSGTWPPHAGSSSAVRYT
jgi:hypothetical protein